MKLFDLSHPLNNESPVYPGNEQPRFRPAASIGIEGYRETYMEIGSHLGTHIDAPAHMLENGMTLDQMPIDTFSGNAYIITVPDEMKLIEEFFLLMYEEKLRVVDFVLFKTGWSKFWNSSHYFENFPVLTMEAVNWLLSLSLKGIGFDLISADPMESTVWENHYAILGKGLILIENLTFPEDLTADAGKFSCYPLPFENADGSPVRAVLEVV